MGSTGGGPYEAGNCPLCGAWTWSGRCETPDCYFHAHPRRMRNRRPVRVKNLDQILMQYFGGGPDCLGCSPTTAYYQRLIDLLIELYRLAGAAYMDDLGPLLQALETRSGIPARESLHSGENVGKTLDDILIEYFGRGFPTSLSPWCEAYDKLVALLNDVGELTFMSMTSLIRELEIICYSDVLRDKDGDVIADELKIMAVMYRRQQGRGDGDE